MATIKVRHLTTRPGRAGSQRHFWQPATALKALGWKTIRLADEKADAVRQAEAINGALDAWRADPRTPVLVRPEFRPLLLSVSPAGIIAADPRLQAPPSRQRKKRPGEKDQVFIQAKPPGSLSALIAAYRQSKKFTTKATKTRSAYEDNLRALEAWDIETGWPPIEEIGPHALSMFYDRLKETVPVKARAVIGMAKIVFSWGLEQQKYWGYVTRTQRGGTIQVPDNPAKKVETSLATKRRTEDDLWTEAEVEALAAAAEDEGYYSIGTAVHLNLWCGQREGDILAATRAEYRRGELRIEQSKTGAVVRLPIDRVPSLVARLEEQKQRNVMIAEQKHLQATTLLVCETTGRPWKVDHFRHKFADIRAVAMKATPSLATKTYMTLRHTVVVRLAEAGCEILEIASVTGHTPRTVATIIEKYHVATAKQSVNAFNKRLSSEVEDAVSETSEEQKV